MFPKNVSAHELTLENIKDLIKFQVPEGKEFEYKSELFGGTDGDKKEFLGDIISFANASGGYLFYGIETKEEGDSRIPAKVKGCNISNPDEALQRLESIVATGVDPRLYGIQMSPIEVEPGVHVIAIKIDKSWNLPHMVNFKGSQRFYTRNSVGKVLLDASEIRRIILFSESITERINNFRIERISKIISDDLPIPLEQNAKVILHLVPVSALGGNAAKSPISFGTIYDKLPPFVHHGWDKKLNFDGLVTYWLGNGFLSYAQLFSDGRLESVDAFTLKPDRDGELRFSATTIEANVMDVLPDYLLLLKSQNIGLPLFLILTVVGVKGFRQWRHHIRSHEILPLTIDRDVLLIPSEIIETYDTKLDTLVQPIFNALWRACGSEKSPNFDGQGAWKKPY